MSPCRESPEEFRAADVDGSLFCLSLGSSAGFFAAATDEPPAVSCRVFPDSFENMKNAVPAMKSATIMKTCFFLII